MTEVTSTAPSKRTTFSRWVYRLTILLFSAAAVRIGDFYYDQIADATVGAGRAVHLAALLTAMSTPLTLIVIAVAMLLRSGAAVWIAGLLAFQTTLVLLIPMWADPSMPFGAKALLLAFVAICLAVGGGVFWYLVRRTELRRP